MKIAARCAFCLYFALCVALPAAFAEEAPPDDVPLYSQAELDQMLAPVALYPDQLLSQVLMAATYPLEVVEAARWSRANPDLKGEDAVRAVDGEDWDPSVKAMVAFPEILDRMDADLDWTRRLGDAFLAQQTGVMDTVQELRRRAQQAGNLSSNEYIEVEEQGPTIVVRRARPDVIYVPYYNPWVVYGSWWWPGYSPVYWEPWYGYRPRMGFTGFYWGPGITIGTGFFFSSWDWHHHDVRVVERPPFYYHHSPPVRNVWVHDYQHRRGVPYRSLREYHQFAGNQGRAPRVTQAPRPYRADHAFAADPRYRAERSDDRRASGGGADRATSQRNPRDLVVSPRDGRYGRNHSPSVTRDFGRERANRASSAVSRTGREGENRGPSTSTRGSRDDQIHGSSGLQRAGRESESRGSVAAPPAARDSQDRGLSTAPRTGRGGENRSSARAQRSVREPQSNAGTMPQRPPRESQDSAAVPRAQPNPGARAHAAPPVFAPPDTSEPSAMTRATRAPDPRAPARESRLNTPRQRNDADRARMAEQRASARPANVSPNRYSRPAEGAGAARHNADRHVGATPSRAAPAYRAPEQPRWGGAPAPREEAAQYSGASRQAPQARAERSERGAPSSRNSGGRRNQSEER